MEEDDAQSVATPPTMFAAEDEGAHFILARLQELQDTEKSGLESFTFSIKQSLLSIRQSFNSQNSEIDWEFWTRLLEDYETVAKKHPRMLNRKLQSGIPDPVRGLVWQQLCRSTKETETLYKSLLARSSNYEKLIVRDLNRTFPKHEYFQQQINQDSLFNVAKAYSLYDPEVGYCQGIPFVVGPLLLYMPEEQAFGVLVQIMKGYNFRDMYTPQMKGLQLRLFQFDELVKENLPLIHIHLDREGIRSSMYASQWFMTLFAYRFPLEIVFRIYDIVLAEGFESVFKFAVALLKKNQQTLLLMEFESLIDFLKNGLFDAYQLVDQLMVDASCIKITKSRLDKLQQDWETEQKKLDPENLDVDALRVHSRHLSEQLKRMDKAYEQLNMEHVQISNELLESRLKYDGAVEKCEELQEQVDSLRKVISADRNDAEDKVRDEMEMLANKNVQLIKRNAELEDTVTELETMLIQVRMMYAESETLRQEERSKRTN